MTERQVSILRQYYLVPECPTVVEVHRRASEVGVSASESEIRSELWALPVELLVYRRIPSANIAKETEQLYRLEEQLMQVWQDHCSAKVQLPSIRIRLIDIIDKVQRALRFAVQQEALRDHA